MEFKAFVHISNAFSYCPREEIGEKFYEPRISGNKLLSLVDSLNDELLTEITPKVLGEWPNTYIFSKASAEELVQSEGGGLPIAIVRPSFGELYKILSKIHLLH